MTNFSVQINARTIINYELILLFFLFKSFEEFHPNNYPKYFLIEKKNILKFKF